MVTKKEMKADIKNYNSHAQIVHHIDKAFLKASYLNNYDAEDDFYRNLSKLKKDFVSSLDNELSLKVVNITAEKNDNYGSYKYTYGELFDDIVGKTAILSTGDSETMCTVLSINNSIHDNHNCDYYSAMASIIINRNGKMVNEIVSFSDINGLYVYVDGDRTLNFTLDQ